MSKSKPQQRNLRRQITISVLLILAITLAGLLLEPLNDYRLVALLLLLTVSILAIVQDIIPVLLTAVVSAAVLNFFFIEPAFNFKIGNSESLLLVWVFLCIALVSAVLTYKIRQNERKDRDREEKEKTLRLYDSILSSLSHELRTPVSAIIGSVDTLTDDKISLSGNDRDHLISEIGIAALRLNAQVESLLSMNRLETGSLKLHLDWWDANELIYSAIRKAAPHSQPGCIRFAENDTLPLFRIDGPLIEQAIFSLIRNAQAHNTPDVTIDIQARLTDNYLHLSVADNGKGIPSTERERVFEKFYRAAGKPSGGLGLGLTIVKGFTEAHNGTISIREDNARGAIFDLKIPAESSYVNNLKHE